MRRTFPLITGTCGELVDRYFLLTAAGEPGTEVDCEVPAGVPLVATPGGAISWRSKGVESRDDLLANRDEAFVF